MITFEKIRYKNLLSTGNAFNEINLNTSINTCINAVNGGGKCLDKSTEIEVRFDSFIDEFDGKSLRNLRDRNWSVTIGDIVDLFIKHPEYKGYVDVKTRYGFYPILEATCTAVNSEVYEIKTENGLSLKTSPEHLMLSDYDWSKTINLRVGDTLHTEFGTVLISSIEKLDYTDDLYDLQVEEVEEFYANGLISHNSTILDALTFSLYGKPFRNISKNQLVNSINGKNLLTEIEFVESGINYKVVRGIKPGIFEIWQNDVLLNQESATKDYQTILEQQILKMNYKTFTQVVILGSSSFVPFMKLSSSQRREIVEDILDIRIFSTMNTLLKEQSAKTKEEIKYIDTNLTLAKNKVESQQKIIKHLESNKQSEIDFIQSKIDEHKESNVKKTNALQILIKEIDNRKLLIVDKEQYSNKYTSLNNSIRKFKHEIDSLSKSITFFTSNQECELCKQEITHDHSGTILESLNESVSVIRNSLLEHESEFKIVNEKLDEIDTTEKQISKLNSEKVKIESEVLFENKQIDKLIEDLHGAANSIDDIDKEKGMLKELVDNAISWINRKNELLEKAQIEEAGLLMLKDGGIKSAIIREYVPTMNTIINKYLHIMDFYVGFQLDENFNETIKSRFRDQMTYDNFSEGEKSRIDIALLFCWREIAKLKNSANTNLLVLDEILDSSLDFEGSDKTFKLLENLNGISVFVISHNETNRERFNNTIKIEKRNDFSVIIEDD